MEAIDGHTTNHTTNTTHVSLVCTLVAACCLGLVAVLMSGAGPARRALLKERGAEPVQRLVARSAPQVHHHRGQPGSDGRGGERLACGVAGASEVARHRGAVEPAGGRLDKVDARHAIGKPGRQQ
eukprot:SAG31_NODE_612_length_13548_cov_171.183285_5_plen_125_part_00